MFTPAAPQMEAHQDALLIWAPLRDDCRYAVVELTCALEDAPLPVQEGSGIAVAFDHEVMSPP